MSLVYGFLSGLFSFHSLLLLDLLPVLELRNCYDPSMYGVSSLINLVKVFYNGQSPQNASQQKKKIKKLKSFKDFFLRK